MHQHSFSLSGSILKVLSVVGSAVGDSLPQTWIGPSTSTQSCKFRFSKHWKWRRLPGWPNLRYIEGFCAKSTTRGSPAIGSFELMHILHRTNYHIHSSCICELPPNARHSITLGKGMSQGIECRHASRGCVNNNIGGLMTSTLAVESEALKAKKAGKYASLVPF